MSYPIDWQATRENGLRVLNSTVNPISGPSSLLLFSDGSEWDSTDVGFRKSASLFLQPTYDRGYSNGRIQTLIRRNVSTLQTAAWAGIYLGSEREGIGTRADPGESRYEITDRDGDIQLIKYTDAIPETLETSVVSFAVDVVYGFQVRWRYDSSTDSLIIRVFRGTALDFSDLVEIIHYTDNDSPYHLGVTEGLFAQTDSNTDVVSYTFDTTSIFQSSHL